MKKLSKIIMLPTEKASKIIRNPMGRLDYKEIPINGYEGFKAQHLYFLSDDEIRDGDWVYGLINGTHEVYQFKNISGYESPDKRWKKIIATTDKSLGLPRPSNEFIKKYCELEGIDEVLVEYEECNICQDTNKHIVSMFGEVDCYYCTKTEGREKQYIEPKLKVAPDNTINIEFKDYGNNNYL